MMNFDDGPFLTLADALRPVDKPYLCVDLKWSLWVRSPEDMDEYAPGLSARLEDAFKGGVRQIVYTAPRKEIRFGTVTVDKGKAYVDFRAVWDEPRCLLPESLSMDDLAVDRLTDWFINRDGFEDEDSPVGARVERVVEAESFPQLMAAIDKCEDELLELEKKNGKELDEFLRSLEG